MQTSPGPLAGSHQALDAAVGCNQCHVDGTPALSTAKCLDCHEHRDLAMRIAAGKGLHATPTVRAKECWACHQDHRGRSFDVMGWKALPGRQRGFDHALTGWKLEGAHAGLACDRCHSAKNTQGLATFLGTDRLCLTCHRTQPHGFRDPKHAITRCERCHEVTAWQPPRTTLQFDHDDRGDAAFPLGADHDGVACAKCHPNGVFTLPAADFQNCLTCHPKGPPKRPARRR